MPRVASKTKNTGGKHTYRCSRCGEPVKPGDRYYTWARRFGRSGARYYQHATCGYPRPTQLSSRKTAQVEEAVQDADTTISTWAPELPEGATAGTTLEIDYSDLKAALDEAASAARDCGSEYESGADNMPESLQYGSQAEAMRDVAQRLEAWADELEGWDPSVETSIEVPDDEDALQGLWDDAVEQVRSDAQDHLNSDGVPEYEG